MRKKRTVNSNDIFKTLGRRKIIGGKKIQWKFEYHTHIRAMIDSKCFCPITLYCFIKTGKFFDQMRFSDAARKCGIPQKTAYMIAGAADVSFGNPRTLKIRKRLLKISHLSSGLTGATGN